MGKCYLSTAKKFAWILLYLQILICANWARANGDLEPIEFNAPWGKICFFVEVADDAIERSRGLMFVEHMPENQGMLFVYDAPHTAAFWMKNTKISLDLIFLNAKGEVAHIHHSAAPMNEQIISGGDDIQYVVEINGGLSKKTGISLGLIAHHSAFSRHVIEECKLEY